MSNIWFYCINLLGFVVNILLTIGLYVSVSYSMTVGTKSTLIDKLLEGSLVLFLSLALLIFNIENRLARMFSIAILGVNIALLLKYLFF
jgi:hypothetical protein